jgi:exodeoxyribonuclease VII large subunit
VRHPAILTGIIPFRLTAHRALSMLRSVDLFSALNLTAKVWPVGDLTRHIRQIIESDYRLQDVWVMGEISNLSRPASGHVYFTLKDERAALRCVMWRSEAAGRRVFPKEGEAAEVHGYISVYDAGGQYQLYADAIRAVGEGELYQEFLRLKAKLEAEGLFDPERKRSLPEWPRRIGVVTSPDAAALQDVIHVLRRRYPLVTLVLSPTPVQGEQAPPRIVAALEALLSYGNVDVILVVRGGGSMEDLWVFNDESVVRAVAGSSIPTVSGIGHETDFILTDFAADVRAPTPSAAAEVTTPDRQNLSQELDEARLGMIRRFGVYLAELRRAQQKLRVTLNAVSPRAQIRSARLQTDELRRHVFAGLRHTLSMRRAAVAGITKTLNAVSPISVLERGYALVRRSEDGALVRSIHQVSPGDHLRVRVSDGAFGAETTSSGDPAEEGA